VQSLAATTPIGRAFGFCELGLAPVAFFITSRGFVDDGEVSRLSYEDGYIVNVRGAGGIRILRPSLMPDKLSSSVRRRGCTQSAYNIILNGQPCRTALWTCMGPAKVPLI